MPATGQYLRRDSFFVPVILALALAVCLPGPARAIAPDSPEVKQMVERALTWLETQTDDRLGGQCLIGLAFYKAGRKADHPKVLAATNACLATINNVSSLDNQSAPPNYSLGLALVFLLETDPEKNRSVAAQYVQEILRRQQRWGSWGYADNPQGDTSQTQYPALGLWLAINHGIDVPAEAVERICGWLLRTQDPSGAWGYQGQDPGNYQRVNQNEIRPALAAAGLGSLYICSDILGVADIKPVNEKNPDNLPSALKPVGPPPEAKKRPAVRSFDVKQVRQAIADGNYWFTKNFTMESELHTHYYLYAFERYQSFREAAERQTNPSPPWYDQMVAQLKRTQGNEGYWSSADGNAVATSFSVLALSRSAKKTLANVSKKLGDGVLLGGMGLPKNTADLQERDGKVVEKLLAGTIDELMTTIEKGNRPELERLAESSARWKLDSDVTRRSGEIARLRAVVAKGPFESRLLAVRALARVRELDNVPVLIYALTDPDMRIVREADKGLRFISRKFDGVGLPEEPKPTDAPNAIAAWKAWYQAIRPSAEFLD
jgi:hypothetical protein